MLNGESTNHTKNFHIVKIVDHFSNNSNNFFVNYPGQPESIRQLSQKLLPIATHPKARNSTLFNQMPGHKSKRGTKERKTTVEIAVFFDAAAYRVFAPHYNYNVEKIRDMLLAYINGVNLMKIQFNFIELLVTLSFPFSVKGSVAIPSSVIGYTNRFNDCLYGNNEITADRPTTLLWGT